LYDGCVHNYLKRFETVNANEILMIPDLEKFKEV
jgi:hypothetical protein